MLGAAAVNGLAVLRGVLSGRLIGAGVESGDATGSGASGCGGAAVTGRNVPHGSHRASDDMVSVLANAEMDGAPVPPFELLSYLPVISRLSGPISDAPGTERRVSACWVWISPPITTVSLFVGWNAPA